jgi:hypothetical protein
MCGEDIMSANTGSDRFQSLRASAFAVAVSFALSCNTYGAPQSVVGWGEMGYSNLKLVSPARQMAGGGAFTVAIKADGAVACWGYNG